MGVASVSRQRVLPTSVPVRPQARAGWRFSFLNEASRDFWQLRRDSRFENAEFGSICIHLDFTFQWNLHQLTGLDPLARKPKWFAACHRVRSPPAITAADWSSESGRALFYVVTIASHTDAICFTKSAWKETPQTRQYLTSWIFLGVVWWRPDQGRTDGGASSQTRHLYHALSLFCRPAGPRVSKCIHQCQKFQNRSHSDFPQRMKGSEAKLPQLSDCRIYVSFFEYVVQFCVFSVFYFFCHFALPLATSASPMRCPQISQVI